MIVGTTIFKFDGNPFYTPEFGRGGLAAAFPIDCMNIVGAPTVSVQVQHRNSDEQSFSNVGTAGSITATGVTNIDVSSLKEIVRLEFSFDAGDDATDAIHFLVQAPSWRPYA